MKTLNKIENINQKENNTMKTLAKGIHSEKTLNQTILTIALVLLSIVAFGQNTSDENPFTSKKFKTIRGDVNKSNPVAGVTLDHANSGSGNQIETNYNPNRKLDVYRPVTADVLPKRQKVENNSQYTSRNLRNYPNPFVDRTTIEYEVERPDYVNLAIYKNGLLVKIVSSEFQNAGNHRAVFDATGLPAGTYTAVLNVGNNIMTQAMYKMAIRDEIVK